MRRKTVQLIEMLVFGLLTATCAAHAQPATKVYRIGYVKIGTAAATPSWDEAFKQRLQELGYTEGQNLVIEARFANGQVDLKTAQAMGLTIPPPLLFQADEVIR